MNPRMKRSRFSEIIPSFQDYIDSRNLRWLPKDSLRRRFAKGVLWSFSGTIVSNMAGLTVSIIVARLLGKVGYGELGIVVSTYALFSQLGSLGLGVTATKHIAELLNSDKDAAGSIAGMTILIAAFSYGIASLTMLLFAADLATKILNAPHIVNQLRFASLLLLLGGLDGVQVGILSGCERFQAIARVQVLRALANILMTTLGAWFYGLTGVIGAMVGSSCLTVYINRVAINRACMEIGISLNYKLNWSRFKILWKFSLPAFIASLLVVPSSWILNALLVNRPNGYVEMGLFNAANQWRALAILVPGIFNSVVLSIQSSLFGADDHKNYHKGIIGNLLIQSSAALLIVGVIVTAAPLIIKAYGTDFRDAQGVLVWLALSWFFLTPNWIIWNVLVSSNQVWLGVLFNAIGAATLLTLAWQLVHFGAEGIALSYFFSSALQVFLQVSYFLYWRHNQLLGIKTGVERGESGT